MGKLVPVHSGLANGRKHVALKAAGSRRQLDALPPARSAPVPACWLCPFSHFIDYMLYSKQEAQ